ncbi:MAG: AsmA family protein [Deltaproteobacteria bacterium]|nr:AsmA family protein [Deltaproteobacteria bacterium]
MKAVKWIVIVGCGLVVLVIAALLIIPMFVDIQKYKPEIEQQVQKATGRPFSIGGDLKLSLFPLAGIAFSDLHMGSPEGFKEKDLIYVKSFDVKVKLLPLISRDIQVKRFVMAAPRIVLEKNRKGRGNWEGIGKPGEKAPAQAPEGRRASSAAKPGEALPIKGLAVGEFAIRDGSVLWIDEAKGERREIRDLTLVLTDVSLDRPLHLLFSAALDGQLLRVEGKVGPLGKEPGKGEIPLDVSVKAFEKLALTIQGSLSDPVAQPHFDLALDVAPFSPRELMKTLERPFPVNTRDPEALNSVAFRAKVKGNPGSVSIKDGAVDLDQSKITFTAEAGEFSRPKVAFALKLDQIDVDRYLPPPSEKGTGEEKGKEAPGRPEGKKTDYAPLRKLVLDGEIRAGKILVMGAQLTDMLLKVRARNGILDVDPFSLKAYQGDLTTTTRMDVRGDVPKTRIELESKGLMVRGLLNDVLNKDFLEGGTYAKLDLRMEGDEPERIKKTLNGKGDLRFTDGAIIGIDLPGMVRNLEASFGLAERPTEKPKTDFSELSIPFSITDGIFHTPQTTMASPLLRLLAAGKADLVKETLDFRVEPKFVATLKGQGDEKERGGLVVPVIVSGTFQSPSFRPDLEGMLKKGLQEGIPKPEQLKDMLKGGEGEQTPKKGIEDATKGLLKKLPFGQ